MCLPWGSFGSSWVVGLCSLVGLNIWYTRARPSGGWIHAGLLGSLACVPGIVGSIRRSCVHSPEPRGLSVHSVSLGSLSIVRGHWGYSVVVGFTLTVPVGCCEIVEFTHAPCGCR